MRSDREELSVPALAERLFSGRWLESSSAFCSPSQSRGTSRLSRDARGVQR